MSFKPGQPGKFWFNLPGYIKFRLTRAVQHIALSNVDTYQRGSRVFQLPSRYA